MDARKLLDALLIAERLKDATRHCYTAGGRHESVAEHSWMMTLMAFFMRDEFPDAVLGIVRLHARFQQRQDAVGCVAVAEKKTSLCHENPLSISF